MGSNAIICVYVNDIGTHYSGSRYAGVDSTTGHNRATRLMPVKETLRMHEPTYALLWKCNICTE